MVVACWSDRAERTRGAQCVTETVAEKILLFNEALGIAGLDWPVGCQKAGIPPHSEHLHAGTVF
jgi:hypothetical protein